MSSTQFSSSQHFVLVHGIGHGAWCWFEIQTLLKSSGHKVTCLDLAGAGIHPSNADDIRTFQEYDKPLFDFMSSLPIDEKVVLVGHSAGGLSLTHVMHEFTEKIEAAIFIAATMLPFGFRSQEDMNDAVPDLSAFGDVCKLRFSLGADGPPTSGSFKTEFQRPILYQLTPEPVSVHLSKILSEISVNQVLLSCKYMQYSTLASMLLRPWPALAIRNAIFEGEVENINKIKRVFIKTSKDNVVKPEQQDAMIRKWPPNEVFIMETDHSPFFSDTQQLFKLLLQAVYE